MTHPMPTLALRRIRLVRGIIKCPDCEKPSLHSIQQSGYGFQRCSLQKTSGDPRGQHNRHATDVWKGRCDGEWWSIALPPDCFGGWMAAILGDQNAHALILRCWPQLASVPVPQLWYTRLIDDTEPAWIQIAVRPRERHLYRTAKVSDFLHLLLRNAA